MRVGVNTLFLIPNEVGGTEIYARSVLPAMLAADPALELIIFTNDENHDSFADYPRVHIPLRAQSRPKRILAEQLALPAAVRDARIDLLYSPGYTIPLRAACAQVVTIHDTQFLDVPEGFSFLSFHAQRALISRAARRADAITTVSDFSRHRIHHHFGAPLVKIFVAHSALSGLFKQPHPSPVEPPYLLYIANTYPHKNAARLVQAFDRIKEEIPHTLVICGKAREGEPPSHPRMRRILHVTDDELVGLVRAADLMVFPSLYEGFGRPVVEAQEAGVLVIASNAASIPEIGGPHVPAFDPTDVDAIATAILHALRMPEDIRRPQLEQGLANARRFTWPACATQTLAAFHHALSAIKS